MVNKLLFNTKDEKILATQNEAGGLAYKRTPESALAQYAITGTFNDTFYTSAKDQLKEVLKLANEVSPEFLAKAAIYSRRHGFMKDMPSFLLAVLSIRNPKLFKSTFDQVIDNGKMLRNFAQIIRSGVVGRKSFGNLPKRMIKDWLSRRTDEQIFHDSVGKNPSLADIIKMVHSKPNSESRDALYKYLLGKDLTNELFDKLPSCVKEFEIFKKDQTQKIPNIPFQMLTALPLTREHWAEIAKNSKWTMARMNLNTFMRHGVFEDLSMVDLISEKLTNQHNITKAKAFPYQLMSSYFYLDEKIPTKIKIALQKALEYACKNIPEYNGKIHIMVDISGSMRSPITGLQKKESKIQCHQVAAMIASAILRKNPETEIILFHDRAYKVKLNPLDSILTNAEVIMKEPGGGTNCAAPMELLNRSEEKSDLIIMISDNQSWSVFNYYNTYYNTQTDLQKEWEKFKRKNNTAKMVCIDIQANSTSQAESRVDTLNVGGFSDIVFDVIGHFIKSDGTPNFWVDTINSMANI